ncbi:unnamed protein product [Absidia cylindrospora]
MSKRFIYKHPVVVKQTAIQEDKDKANGMRPSDKSLKENCQKNEQPPCKDSNNIARLQEPCLPSDQLRR